MFWLILFAFLILVQLEINAINRKKAKLQELAYDKYAEARETAKEQLRNGR